MLTDAAAFHMLAILIFRNSLHANGYAGLEPSPPGDEDIMEVRPSALLGVMPVVKERNLREEMAELAGESHTSEEQQIFQDLGADALGRDGEGEEEQQKIAAEMQEGEDEEENEACEIVTPGHPPLPPPFPRVHY